MSVSVKNAGLPSGLIGGAMAKIFDLMSIRVVKGQFTPGAIGVYNVVRVDDDGQAGPILLAPTDCIVGSLMKSTADLSGAATVQLFAAAATTTVLGSGSAIGPTRTVADIDIGTINLGTTLTTAVGVIAANAYVNADVASATISGGNINVTLLVMNAKNPQ